MLETSYIPFCNTCNDRHCSDVSYIGCMFLSCHVRVLEWIYSQYIPDCQLTPCSKQARYFQLYFILLYHSTSSLFNVLSMAFNNRSALGKSYPVVIDISWNWVTNVFQLFISKIKLRNSFFFQVTVATFIACGSCWIFYHTTNKTRFLSRS